jgi:hypothetical protein
VVAPVLSEILESSNIENSEFLIFSKENSNIKARKKIAKGEKISLNYKIG